MRGSLAQALSLREMLRAELLDEGRHARKQGATTLEIYARSWLERRVVRLKPSTAERYATALSHLLAEFGALRLVDLRPGDLETWQSAAVQAGWRPATVNGWLRVVRSLARDSARDLDLPDWSRGVRALPEGPPRRHGLTLSEVRRIVEHVRDHDPSAYPLLLLLVLTGMRWGEATALRVDDVDEIEGLVHVRRAHWRGNVGLPKSGRSRICPLPPELAEVLRARRRQLLEGQSPGLADGWLFATSSRAGGVRLPTPSSWKRRIQAWCNATAVRLWSPHDLRRTWVDVARAAGLDQSVRMALVGHAGRDVHQRYSTVRPAEAAAGAGAVVRLVCGDGGAGGGAK